MLPFLLFAAACTSTEGESRRAFSGGDPDDLGPYAAATVWGPEDVAEIVQAMLGLGFPNPRAPYLAYLALMEQGDEACPGDPTQLVGQEMAQGGCTATSGVHYEGNTTLVEVERSDETGAQRGFQLAGDFRIEGADGVVLEGGGTMLHSVTESAGGRRDWVAQSAGTWRHTRADDWLGRGISATVGVNGVSGSAGDDRLLLDGTLGIDGVFVEFESLSWADDCGGNPRGALHVRDPSGVWGTVSFGDRCDGCGDWVVEATAETGEVCLDLRSYGSAVVELGTW